MKSIKVISIGNVAFALILIFLVVHKANTFPTVKDNKAKQTSLKRSEKVDVSANIIKGATIDMIKGRRPYNLNGRKILTKHFVVRVTKPGNPFQPHKHDQSELWFIIEGNGIVFLNGIEYDVEANDLIILDPWMEHGLSTISQITWLCIG